MPPALLMMLLFMVMSLTDLKSPLVPPRCRLVTSDQLRAQHWRMCQLRLGLATNKCSERTTGCLIQLSKEIVSRPKMNTWHWAIDTFFTGKNSTHCTLSRRAGVFTPHPPYFGGNPRWGYGLACLTLATSRTIPITRNMAGVLLVVTLRESSFNHFAGTSRRELPFLCPS